LKPWINNSQISNDSFQYEKQIGFLINNNQISNDSFQYEKRMEFLKNQCQDGGKPSASMLQHLINRNTILNHLGFILRSHSLFYCSVPKVATRTLLTYITYLHIQDELITALTSNSTSYFNKNSTLFDVEYLNKTLSNSTGVSEPKMNSIEILLIDYI
jgi:hypothetical protein